MTFRSILFGGETAGRLSIQFASRSGAPANRLK